MTSGFQPSRGEGRRLLIIDDDEAVLGGLAGYFEQLGYTAIRAPTGRAGIAAFGAHEPDVTILDLRLPDIDGLQVLEVLRQKKAMVVLLTGYGDIPTAVQAMRLGAENFLTKPVEMDHLVATVERAVEKVELGRENIRLRGLVPTGGKKARRALAAVVLVAAAWALGWMLGGDGMDRPEPPAIAPTRELPRTLQGRRVDSLVNVPTPVPISDSLGNRKSPSDTGKR
jgi:FixJ family two-component response regulator